MFTIIPLKVTTNLDGIYTSQPEQYRSSVHGMGAQHAVH